MFILQFEEVVQYVIGEYPHDHIEDLKGDVSLLTILSTPLAVTVVRSHCSEIFSLRHAPALMQQAISPQKVGTSHTLSVANYNTNSSVMFYTL